MCVVGWKCIEVTGSYYKTESIKCVTIGSSRPGHCLGKILVNCAYCFTQKLGCDIAVPLRVSPARVTWQL